MTDQRDQDVRVQFSDFAMGGNVADFQRKTVERILWERIYAFHGEDGPLLTGDFLRDLLIEAMQAQEKYMNSRGDA